MNEKLKEIEDWLNENYNQESENYSIFFGAKPEVIKYDEHSAISFWGCGAVVCIGSILYFIEEDDGNWKVIEGQYRSGVQDPFSIGWAKGFAEAINGLIEYTEKNGEPVYFSGTDAVCHYQL